MRGRIFKSNEQNDNNSEDIKKLQNALRTREKKLKKKEESLQRKIKAYEKRANCRAKADLRAAAKLRTARKKLLFALDSRDKLQECNSRNCKPNKLQKKVNHDRFTGKRKRKEENPFADVVFNFCDKLISGPCKQSNAKKSVLDFKRFRPNSRCLQHMVRPRGNELTRSVSHEVYVSNLAAGDCYLKSLPRTPQPWIYHRWPKLYPQYLSARKQWKNMGYLMLFTAGFLLWLPILACLEICKCFYCACCCDCQ